MAQINLSNKYAAPVKPNRSTKFQWSVANAADSGTNARLKKNNTLSLTY